MNTASLISVISAESDIGTDVNDSLVKLTDMLNGFLTKCKRDRQTNPSDLVNYTFETKLLGSHVLFFPPCLKFRQEKLGQSDNDLLQTPSYKVQTTRTEIN